MVMNIQSTLLYWMLPRQRVLLYRRRLRKKYSQVCFTTGKLTYHKFLKDWSLQKYFICWLFKGTCGFIERSEEDNFNATMCGEICHANPFETGTFFCEKDEKCCPIGAFEQTCSPTCGPYNISGTLWIESPSNWLYIYIVHVLIIFLYILSSVLRQ